MSEWEGEGGRELNEVFTLFSALFRTRNGRLAPLLRCIRRPSFFPSFVRAFLRLFTTDVARTENGGDADDIPGSSPVHLYFILQRFDFSEEASYLHSRKDLLCDIHACLSGNSSRLKEAAPPSFPPSLHLASGFLQQCKWLPSLPSRRRRRRRRRRRTISTTPRARAPARLARSLARSRAHISAIFGASLLFLRLCFALHASRGVLFVAQYRVER